MREMMIKNLVAMGLAGCLMTGCVRSEVATNPDKTTTSKLSDREKVERFAKVEKGMTMEQVVALLGAPRNAETNRLWYVAYDGPHHQWNLEVLLKDGIVTNATPRHYLEYPERNR
jgi:outer membrane protein assembly factor BamE (lipoprotein component of BamABCDE complex)